jgi:L-fuconolactonase
MKIDTHQHYWHYEPLAFPWIGAAERSLMRDFLPAHSAAAMQACGVDAVLAVQARSVAQETQFLLGLATQDPRIVGVIGWLDLTGVDLEAQLDRFSVQPALRGLRHILQDEADLTTLINHAAFNRGVSVLQSRQLVYEVLVFDHQLPAAVDFCARHDAHWLVLDHLGKPKVRDWFDQQDGAQRWAACLRELASMPHVLCKLSGLVTETGWQHSAGLLPADVRVIHSCFDLALEVFGPQRLMFGSDWPVCQLATPYESVHQIAQSWALSRLDDAQQQAFWSTNAVLCYGLNVQALTREEMEP